MILNLGAIEAVEVVTGLDGAAHNLVDSLGFGDLVLLLQGLGGRREGIPPRAGGLKGNGFLGVAAGLHLGVRGIEVIHGRNGLGVIVVELFAHIRGAAENGTEVTGDIQTITLDFRLGAGLGQHVDGHILKFGLLGERHVDVDVPAFHFLYFRAAHGNEVGRTLGKFVEDVISELKARQRTVVLIVEDGEKKEDEQQGKGAQHEDAADKVFLLTNEHLRPPLSAFQC